MREFFANPLKPFLMEHYDFKWLDQLRTSCPPASSILDLVKPYLKGESNIEANILNPSTINRTEAANMVEFYKQMLVSSRALQLNDYITINHRILQELRQTYPLD